MPNWCSTSIRILNPNQDTLRNLEQEFENAFRCNEIENGFGRMWLGNILSYLGYSANDVLHGSIHCRGEIDDIDLLDAELRISTETAWMPMLQPILMMVDKYAPDSDVLYCAVESGCEIYATNDPDMIGGIYIDIYGDLPENLAWIEEVAESFITEHDFLRRVADSSGWVGSDKELREKVFLYHRDYYGYHEWDCVEASEWQ